MNPRVRIESVLKGLAAAGLALRLAGPAAAINFTWGDVRVQQLSEYGFVATNSVLSFDGGTTDELYQMYGYLGNANGVVPVQASNFNVATAISRVGNVATSSIVLDNNGAADLGLTAGAVRINYTFTAIDDTSVWDNDQFLWDITIMNMTGTSLDLVFYSYLDLDLDGAGDFGDDMATATAQKIAISDSSSGKLFVWRASNGGTADHFQVQAFPGVYNLLEGMASATDLSDGAATFGPADFSGAFQYNLSIPAGGSVSLGSTPLTSIPEPQVALLTLVGLLGLTVSSRRVQQRALESRASLSCTG